MPPYNNKGDAYEEKIYEICKQNKIIPEGFQRGGAGNAADIIFIHKNKEHRLEVKNGLGADFGQRTLKWKNGKWSWSRKDALSELYDGLGLINLIDEDFIPNLYTVEHNESIFNYNHKMEDMRAFEQSIPIDTEKLYTFYSLKDCYYIQVGDGFGFYHLQEDVAGLGTSQFKAKLKLRFRAKTVHSRKDWLYGFYGVLKIDEKPTTSNYDLEDKDRFPVISP